MKYSADDMTHVILNAYELAAQICEAQEAKTNEEDEMKKRCAAAIRKAASHGVVK